MPTYYRIRGAAMCAGVSRRTIYRWLQGGFAVNGNRRIVLRAVTVSHRHCIEESYLRAFLAARRKYLDAVAADREKITITSDPTPDTLQSGR